MKNEPRILIDGYNLMHQIVAASVLRSPKGLESGRDQVIRRVGQLVESSLHAVTIIVFDAGSRRVAVSEQPVEPAASGPGVVYALEHPDADSLIEEMIRRHSSPRRLTVVSSDRRLIDAASRRGAKGIRCQDWLDERESAKPEPGGGASGSSRPVPRGGLSAEEREFWLGEFGAGGTGSDRSD